MTPSLLESWLEFEALRKDLERKIHDMELSNFNLTYGSKTEADFRQKLSEARALLDKIEHLVGPARVEPSIT
jgi:predicted translin family RNA/ssDNA-binding protein